MILAIDTGNTNTVIGVINDNNEVIKHIRMGTDPLKTEYEYSMQIEQQLKAKNIDTHCFDGAIISSVVPAVTATLVKAVRAVTGMQAMIVGPGIKTGLQISLDDPGTIAGDLVSTAVAAKEYYPLPCIIIDMGTATTMTVVDASGKYIGGVIMPGAGTSLKALVQDTSLLPSIDFVGPKKTIATNTIDAMKGGIIYGTAGSIDAIIDRFMAELGTEDVSIVATGGMGKIIAPYCRHEITIDNRMLLKGLGLIWKKNQKPAK